MQKKYIIFRESDAENHLECGRLGCDAVKFDRLAHSVLEEQLPPS
jgi:hypothetical protein